MKGTKKCFTLVSWPNLPKWLNSHWFEICDKKQNKTRSWNGQSHNHCGRLIDNDIHTKINCLCMVHRYFVSYTVFFLSDEMPVTIAKKTNHPNTWGVERLRSRGDLTVGTGVLWVLVWHVRCLGLRGLKTRTAERGPTCGFPCVLASVWQPQYRCIS